MRSQSKIGDYLLHGVYFFVYGIFKYVPSPIGDFFRYWITKIFSKKLGKVRIYEGVTIWYPNKLTIGSHVTLNEWVYVSAYGGLTIGNDVRIGHRTSIISSDHSIEDTKTPIYKQPLKEKPVTIEDDVFIGCNVTITGGVRIGKGSVIGAGSIVTKDIPEYSVAVGNPAKVIRTRA